MDSPTRPWPPYPDWLERPRRNGALLRALLGSDTPPAQIRRRGNAAVARDWYSPETRAALGTLGQLLNERLWRRVSSPRARAHCPLLETFARACEPERSAHLSTLHAISDDGFADLDRSPEHSIVRTLARARENQVAALSQARGMRPADPGPPLRDLALSLRLLGVQACLEQDRAEWCPCLRTLLDPGPLPHPHHVLELSIRFSPSYGLGSTA
ncbi:hypothetical protein [Nocardiopsis ganjiahuensis]|uniref:hypothetical protein n=1 Tax=Nocardiopsis ganjiahuensis TaxID=239984 RepID=UPI00034B9341|nr:hypothetical protein [Nocardiopsis ganjiahuensis]